MAIKGIDVSEFQGNINWDKVKADGIEFAILKLGNIYDYDTNYKNSKFETNYKNARAKGIKVGAYIYNYCYLSDVHIEKVTDAKLKYGTDSYSVVATADIVINKISFEDISFVAVVEPHTKNTYASKDCYIAF